MIYFSFNKYENFFVANATFKANKIKLKDTTPKYFYNRILDEGVAVIKMHSQK